MAIQKDGPVHIGIDNQTTVAMCTAITEHQSKRQRAKLRNEWGGMIIGGTTPPLQKSLQSRRPWALTKNGDLWESIEEAIKIKGPESVKVAKVKGHATEEMVEEGKCKAKDKEGNDKSDKAADKGAEQAEMKTAALGHVYSRRHKYYKRFMERVQSFIIKVRKAEEIRMERKRKEEDPFRQPGEAKMVQIPISLKFGSTVHTRD